MLLGLEHFIVERKRAGTWKINLPKLVIVGLPSVIFSLTYHIALLDIATLSYATLGTNFIPVFQIVLGYVLITCVYKVESIDFL